MNQHKQLCMQKLYEYAMHEKPWSNKIRNEFWRKRQRYQATKLLRTLWTLLRKIILHLIFFLIYLFMSCFCFISTIHWSCKWKLIMYILFPNVTFARTVVSLTCTNLSCLQMQLSFNWSVWHLYLKVSGILTQLLTGLAWPLTRTYPFWITLANNIK